MSIPTDPLEALWDHLLSREPDKIRTAFFSLNKGDQKSILAHLQRMAVEPGWHPEQSASAQAALDALDVPQK